MLFSLWHLCPMQQIVEEQLQLNIIQLYGRITHEKNKIESAAIKIRAQTTRKTVIIVSCQWMSWKKKKHA